MIEIWVMMMEPNNDIANNSRIWNKDIDDGIIKITITTSTLCDKWKLYWRNSHAYPTPETTTPNVLNVCCGNGGSNTCNNFTIYLFARHNYEKSYLVCAYFFKLCL